MTDAEIVQKARDALQELEQHFIMMSLRLDGYDIPGVGVISPQVSRNRNKYFMQQVSTELARFRKLMDRGDDYATKKRIRAIRQRFFVLVHLNKGCSRMRKNWLRKSAMWCAGKFLLGVFENYLTWNDLR